MPPGKPIVNNNVHLKFGKGVDLKCSFTHTHTHTHTHKMLTVEGDEYVELSVHNIPILYTLNI